MIKIIKRICNKCGEIIRDGKCKCGSFKTIKAKKEIKNTERVLYTARWQKKRNYIKARDGYYCQRCFHKLGILKAEELEVHHIKNRIDYPELTFEDSNLITICGDCNKFYRGKNELDFEWKPPINSVNLN